MWSHLGDIERRNLNNAFEVLQKWKVNYKLSNILNSLHAECIAVLAQIVLLEDAAKPLSSFGFTRHLNFLWEINI